MNTRVSAAARMVTSVLSAMAIVAPPMEAQPEPAMIPIAVAEAMSLRVSPLLGEPQFFNGVLPTGWPQALVPSNARVLGGGIQGVPKVFNYSTVVLQFASPAEGESSLRRALESAGYKPRPLQTGDDIGGFAPAARNDIGAATFCGDSSFVGFAQLQRSREPNVFSVMMMNGEAGRANCMPPGSSVQQRRGNTPTLPTLTPPKGATFIGGGSTSSGEEGSMRGFLVTTLQADSILYHYRDQLTANGWRVEGRPAVADQVAAQRFAFTNDGEAWLGTLVVSSRGDRSSIQLQYQRDYAPAR